MLWAIEGWLISAEQMKSGKALIGLANMVQGIVNPRPANVVKLEKHLAS